jgi:DNA-binding response OmpR family regulator/HPt (histidine-containing phosphotransfer) domain-containing protein
MQEELTIKYLESLEEKSVLIKTLWEQFLLGDKEILSEIKRHAHSLKGSGATFGFPEISEAGGELEHAGDSELLDKVNALFNVIGRITANGKAKSAKAANEELPSLHVVSSNQALIIERNPDNAKVICDCISRLDGINDCILVETGADARKAYQNKNFSLIVLDLVLPDQDGRELLREIKQSAISNSPVLVISGVPSDSIYLECMSLGADYYLTKPFDTNQLMYEARQLLQSNSLQMNKLPEKEEKETPTSNQLKGEKILVAEDDEMQGLFIAQKLGEQGAEVTVVENGKLALDALQDNNFSAVILDGLMPVMDGFQTLESIRISPRLGGIPVIMVTAMGSEEDIARGFDMGANDYILKPFSKEQLVSRIKSLLVMAA